MSAGLAWQLAGRGLVCAVALWLLWRLFGLFGIVFGSPLVGVLLARPLIDLASELRQGTRALALEPMAGAYYQFRGHPVRVIDDDDDGHRWLLAADLRRVVPGLPADASLQRLLSDGVRRLGTPAALYVEAEAAIGLLARAQEPATVKLVNWIEREVAGPARRRRGA